MNTEKRIKDIGDINSEFQKINEQLKKLESRFTAIAIDYKYYIDTNFSNREIFEHRDNVFYRFKSARLHLDFLVRQHFVVEKRFEEIFKKNPSLFLNEFYPSNPFFDEAEEEVSSIFDSIVYHLVSIFDYISNLIVFVCDKNKTKKLEWTQLAKHARSNKSIYYEKPIGKIISNLDNQFVKKLYNHRSYLIHRKGELNKSMVEIELSKGNFKVKFITTSKFNKNFNQLKGLSKLHHLTIQYVAFWLIENSIAVITELLFALKKEVETNPVKSSGMKIAYLTGDKRMVSPSIFYWQI